MNHEEGSTSVATSTTGWRRKSCFHSSGEDFRWKSKRQDV